LPTREELQKQLQVRAQELKEEADRESTEAVKNVFADLLGLLGFAAVCLFGQRDIQVLRGFIDELVYGLSDSAKAFAIILFTDIFVGFHSPEGWTVLLDGVAEHLGLPARENFILLFIATFPVVLATIFKYWIFRYLNRVSPSSVATLRNMQGGG
ncbi:MAG: proton extrusion protein PcxA, partial [Cyanobium sp.]